MTADGPGPLRPVAPADHGVTRAARRRWPVAAGAAVLLFAALAALLAGQDWAPFGFERSANDWSAAHRPGAARAVAVVITDLGSGVVPYLLALAAGAVTVRAMPVPLSPRRAVPAFLAPLLWLVAGQLVRLGLMYAFERPRPPRVNWACDASGYSFPSGHSFTSAVCAGLLAMAVVRAHPAAARPAVAGAAVFAALVGLSRIYLGVHWPLDVLGGWLLGCAWLAVATAVLPPVRRAALPPGDGEPGGSSEV